MLLFVVLLCVADNQQHIFFEQIWAGVQLGSSSVCNTTRPGRATLSIEDRCRCPSLA